MFHLRLQRDSCTTHLNAKKQLDHPRRRLRVRSGLMTMRLLGVVVVVERMKRAKFQLSPTTHVSTELNCLHKHVQN